MPESAPVCEETKPNSLHPWRCILRAQHDGDCDWPIESEHYNYPLDHFDKEWLEKELRMKLYQMRSMRRDHEAETRGMRARFATLLHGLIELAPGNSKRKNVPTEAVQKLWHAAVS